MKNPSHPIPFDKLVDLVEGRLPPAEQAELRAQVAAWPAATAELAWLERTIELMRTDKLEDAPPHIVARVVSRPLGPKPATEQPHLLRRLVAALSFDSLQMPLAAGIRSGQPAARQLLYHAEDRDLDLRLTPGGAQWVVSGQVLGPDEGGQVELYGPSGTVRADLNTLSEFTLPPVSPGSYTLILRQGAVEVEIPELELGTSSS